MAQSGHQKTKARASGAFKAEEEKSPEAKGAHDFDGTNARFGDCLLGEPRARARIDFRSGRPPSTARPALRQVRVGGKSHSRSMTTLSR